MPDEEIERTEGQRIPSELLETWDLFHQRQEELKEYIDFVSFIINEKADRLYPGKHTDQDRHEDTRSLGITRNLQKTLLSSTYLLLYNMVEATVRNAITALHKMLGSRTDITFDDLAYTLKKVILTNFKKHFKMEDNGLESNTIGKELLSNNLYYDTDLFSGNLDARQIREICKRYGFDDCFKGLRKGKRGECLSPIKKRRNTLAHGRTSFAELGQDLSIDEVHKDFDESVKFLETVLTRIDKFVSDQEFLSA